MDRRIGETVRLRPSSRSRAVMAELADQVGTVGDVWEHAGVVRLNVLYGKAGPLAMGVPAAEFEPAERPAGPA